MGQNDIARPPGAPTGSGPLWCVPVAAGTAVVWGDCLDGHELIGLDGPHGFVQALGRHRIFSNRVTQPFYTVRSQGLQDGQFCTVALRDPAGGETRRTVELRLATWQADSAPQILTFIVARLLPTLDRQQDHGILERFLSLASAWRLPCRAAAILGDRQIYAAAHAPLIRQDHVACFLVSGSTLQSTSLRCFRAGEGLAFVLPRQPVDRAYVEIGGELVELDFSDSDISPDHSLVWLRDLSAAARDRLLDQLSSIALREGVVFPSYVAAALTAVDVPLAEPGSRLQVAGCLGSPDSIVLLLDILGHARLDEVALRAFGSDESMPVAARLARELPGDLGLSRARLAIRADAPAAGQAIACRVALRFGDLTVERWIRVQRGADRTLAAARDFWPLASHDDEFLSTIAIPLSAQGGPVEAHDATRFVRRSRPRRLEEAVRVRCVADRHPDGLHHTLLGVLASAPAGTPVDIVLADRPDLAPQVHEIAGRLDRYGVDGDILVSRSPAQAALPTRLAEGAGPLTVLVRAGHVPPEGAWLQHLSGDIASNPGDIFIGVARETVLVPRRFTIGPSGAMRAHRIEALNEDQLLDLVGADAIVALAVSAGPRVQHPLAGPVTHSLVGRWVEWLTGALRSGARVLVHPALAFWNTNPEVQRDEFALRLDELLLSGAGRVVGGAGSEKPQDAANDADAVRMEADRGEAAPERRVGSSGVG